MLSKISWSEFLGTVSVGLVAYYLFIGAAYFRQDITGFLSKLRKSNDPAKDTKQ